MNRVLLLLPLATMVSCLTFTLNSQYPLFEVSEKFLSVALDSSNIQDNFKSFNLSDPYLAKLINHLAPMYLRVGGTFADRIVFDQLNTRSETRSLRRLPLQDIKFAVPDWLQLCQFTKEAGVKLLFDLNSLMRYPDGAWHELNAEAIIQLSNQRGIDIDWELGNEPDLYNSIYGQNLNASQLAKDIINLRQILNKYSQYKSSYLVGNDMFDVAGNQNNQEYLRTYLNGASKSLHAVTWHHYYFAGKDATEEMFLSPDIFNSLEDRIKVVRSIVSSSGSDNKIWLGETSSAYNGGAEKMSDRFIATFLWLDKLGLGAKTGLDVIIRQSIVRDNYALLNDDYVPNPDWWLSVLYKKLVGTTVLSITDDGTKTNPVRLYAHCAKNSTLWNGSAVVVFGFNVKNENSTINLGGFEADKNIFVYELTSEDSLYSQSILLNGNVLKLSSDGDLPEFKPKLIENTGTYSLLPYSIVFGVFTNTNVSPCAN